MTTQQKKLVEGTDIELYDQEKWGRWTVADGKWLQSATLDPISANDRILASAIHDTSANLTTYIDDSIDEVYENLSAISVDIYNKIDYVSATVDNNTLALYNQIDYVSGDLKNQIFNTSSFLQNEIDTSTQDLRNEISATSSYLQGEIDTLEAATDVVDVVGTHADLLNYNKQLTKDDIVKVLCDETEDNLEYYWRVVGTAKRINPPFTWTPVGSISPYYNKTEIDDKITTLSSTVSSNYLSANGTAVQSGHNIVISANPTEPKILIKTSDNVTFTGISATTLSATTAYGSSAKFDNISSTNLTALTAQGNSAKFTNISSTNLTALTAQGNQVSYTNISGTTLNGATTSINIDNLITAATAGAVSYSGKDGIQINDHDIMLSAKMSAIGNGITNNSAISLSSFKLSADTGIKFNATTDTLGISVSSSIINSAESGASASAYITANSGKFLNSAHSAFSTVMVTFYKDPSGSQHNNTVFEANNSSAEFKFRLGDGLFGEKDSNNTFIITTNNTAITADAMPKTNASAFIYSTAAYTAAGNGITSPYTGYLSALYLSAGNGITFDTTNNKLRILADSALINSAKNGQSAYNWLTANTTDNSAKYAQSATSASTAYNAQTLGGVSSADIIGSAQSGQQAYNWASSAKWSAYQNTGASASGYLYNGLNVSAGKGIILSGSNTSKINIGIDYTTSSVGDTPYIIKIDNIPLSAGSNYTSGRGIGISGTNNEIYVKDEFVPWSASEINLPNTSNTALNTAFSHGLNNTANSASFAQGLENSANTYSIAQGKYNKAYNCAQAFGDNNIIVGGMAIGQNNKTSADVAFVIGNGTDNEHRSDLFLISGNGDIHMAGKSIKMSYGNSNTTISLTGVSRGTMGTSLEVNWSDLVGKNFVYASTNASGSILSADNKVTLVVTATLPTIIPSGYYFIV